MACGTKVCLPGGISCGKEYVGHIVHWYPWQAIYYPCRWQRGGGGNAFSGSNFSIRKCSLKGILLQGGFPWLVPGRKRHPGAPLKLKCLGNAGPYSATALENFVGTSPGGKFYPASPAAVVEIFCVSGSPAGKVVSTHNPSLCAPQSAGTPGNLSSPSPEENVVCTHLDGVCVTAEVSLEGSSADGSTVGWSETCLLQQDKQAFTKTEGQRWSSSSKSAQPAQEWRQDLARRKEHRRKASIPIHWVHCREGAVRLWRRRFAACLMVGMTINYMCEGTSGSVSSILVIHLIGRFFFLLLAQRKWQELIIITIIIMITKIIIAKVGDGKRVKGFFSCFSIGRNQGRKKQNQNQLHFGNS